MSKNILTHIKNYIMKNLGMCRTINLSWFGGEPTLCIDMVLDLSYFVKNLSIKNDTDYVGDMTTNGYLLDLKNFIRFYDAGIRIFQITLDGFLHDKFRMLSTGENTLKVILENIYNILQLDEKYEFELDIRINVNEDNNDLKWYDFLKGYLGEDKRIKYMVAITSNWGGDTIKKVRLINENKKTIKNIHNEYIKNLGLPLVCENKGPCSDV